MYSPISQNGGVKSFHPSQICVSIMEDILVCPFQQSEEVIVLQ